MINTTDFILLECEVISLVAELLTIQRSYIKHSGYISDMPTVKCYFTKTRLLGEKGSSPNDPTLKGVNKL